MFVSQTESHRKKTRGKNGLKREKETVKTALWHKITAIRLWIWSLMLYFQVQGQVETTKMFIFAVAAKNSCEQSQTLEGNMSTGVTVVTSDLINWECPSISVNGIYEYTHSSTASQLHRGTNKTQLISTTAPISKRYVKTGGRTLDIIQEPNVRSRLAH